jgi:shikimate kinase
VAGTPQQPPAVALVGFMGTGKTVVGQGLSERLGLPFVDTDAAIVAVAGPIPSIFESRGESGFRALESEVVVRELEDLARTPKVLALGGGAVLSEDVRRALVRTPHVVWLTGQPAALWARVGAEESRPLARDVESFVTLLKAREPLYREVATVTVDTSGLTPGAVVDSVVAALAAGAGAVSRAGHEEGAA